MFFFFVFLLMENELPSRTLLLSSRALSPLSSSLCLASYRKKLSLAPLQRHCIITVQLLEGQHATKEDNKTRVTFVATKSTYSRENKERAVLLSSIHSLQCLKYCFTAPERLEFVSTYRHKFFFFLKFCHSLVLINVKS